MIGPGFAEGVGRMVAGTILRWLLIAAFLGAVIGAGIVGAAARERPPTSSEPPSQSVAPATTPHSGDRGQT